MIEESMIPRDNEYGGKRERRFRKRIFIVYFEHIHNKLHI